MLDEFLSLLLSISPFLIDGKSGQDKLNLEKLCMYEEISGILEE